MYPAHLCSLIILSYSIWKTLGLDDVFDLPPVKGNFCKASLDFKKEEEAMKRVKR